MANQSNINHRNSRRSTNILQDLNSYDFLTTFPASRSLPTNISNEVTDTSQDLDLCDFLTTFPASWPLPTNISDENRNLDRLKTRINCFFQEHSDLIMSIKNYFYDEVMGYILKCSLKLPFNRTDTARTKRLLNRFFIEHEANIRIIFHYFIDDIKPFLLNNQFLSLTSEFGTINAFLNRGACGAFILLLKTKGAQFLTSKLYPTNIVLNHNENLPDQSTSNQMQFAPILAYVCVLCIIFGWKIFLIMFYFL